MLKVFLGGEGNNELGTRGYVPMGDEPGVVEALLRRVRPSGWRVAAALPWKNIRKYRAGAANQRADHADAHNVRGLVLHAYEEACEMLAFVRDVDGELPREREVHRVLESIADLRFVEMYGYELAIVGGTPRPKLEGWILCLLGAANTDEMSRTRVDLDLARTTVRLKSNADYVALAETAVLPTGAGSLPEWLARAEATFARLIDGELPSRPDHRE
jgi:hypothetical protein